MSISAVGNDLKPWGNCLKILPLSALSHSNDMLLGYVGGAMLDFVLERGHSGVWSIQFNIKLVAAFYGAMQSVVAYYVMGMVVKEKGPVFYSAFNPLATLMVAILGSFVLAEQLYLGSVIGAAVIIIGLYLILWGKAKDQSPPSQC